MFAFTGKRQGLSVQYFKLSLLTGCSLQKSLFVWVVKSKYDIAVCAEVSYCEQNGFLNIKFRLPNFACLLHAAKVNCADELWKSAFLKGVGHFECKFQMEVILNPA